MFQPGCLPDSLGELNQCHVVAVVNFLQQVVELLSHLSNSGVHYNTNKITNENMSVVVDAMCLPSTGSNIVDL